MCSACFHASTAELWERTYHNPVIFLRKVQRSRLNAATNNRYYLEFYDRMMRSSTSICKPSIPGFPKPIRSCATS